MHFIIATHSPFIISDLPKENIIKLVKNDWKTKTKEMTEGTFWANYIDIIRNGFFDGVFLW
jgi:predicted ATP-dependent endonuclease of OLD family